MIPVTVDKEEAEHGCLVLPYHMNANAPFPLAPPLQMEGNEKSHSLGGQAPAAQGLDRIHCRARLFYLRAVRGKGILKLS